MGAPLENGTPDHDVIDAGGQACELVPGGAFFDSLMSFAIVRGGNLDVAILGAFEVSVRGDLANWKIPGKLTPGMGGAMELAQKANRVIIIARHLDRKGRPKLVESCTLPVTAWGCVDTLITERAVFRKRGDRLVLASVHPDHTIDDVLDPINASISASNGIPIEITDPLEPWDRPEEGAST
jgi:3-oxoacid CoA-transferase subunit B